MNRYKLLDKYLYLYPILMIINTSLLLVININKFYLAFNLIFGITTFLYLASKAKLFTKKISIFDKSITSTIFLLIVMQMFFKDFMKNVIGYYCYYFVMAILLVVLKRNFFKNFFKNDFRQIKNKKKSHIKDKPKALDITIQYIFIIGCILTMFIFSSVLISKNTIINNKIFQHLFPVILIIMLMILTLYEYREYKKKSISQK